MTGEKTKNISISITPREEIMLAQLQMLYGKLGKRVSKSYLIRLLINRGFSSLEKELKHELAIEQEKYIDKPYERLLRTMWREEIEQMR